jgi:hypothetical protein
MKRSLVSILLLYWFVLPLGEASRPEQDEITSDIFSEMSQEEYYDFVVRNIVSGGVGRDDIPPINSPVFISAAEARFLEKKDTVFGTVIEDQSYAFPKEILYWHEVVNMEMMQQKYSVTFCPLTGSVVGFLNRNLGVSGKLFNNNLVMYDRETESLIPQILETGVDGDLRGLKLDNFPVVVTTWDLWRRNNPQTLVLSNRTGYSRDYDRNPYPGYESALRLWFPVSASSDLFNNKEIMVGFKIDGKHYAVQKKKFIKRYEKQERFYDLDGKKVRISYNASLKILEIAEVSVEPNVGEGEVMPIHNFEVYWFAWYAYFPTTIVLE